MSVPTRFKDLLPYPTPIGNVGCGKNPLREMIKMHDRGTKFTARDVLVLLQKDRWDILHCFMDVVPVPKTVLEDGLRLYAITVPISERMNAVLEIFSVFGVVV